MKAIIFDSEEHAKQADWNSNALTGSISKYRYSRVPLNDTTVLTKVQYAALYSIPETLTDEDGNAVDNPVYTSLENSYTLRKYALVVGDEHDIVDEDGNVAVPSYVVDISDMVYVTSEV